MPEHQDHDPELHQEALLLYQSIQIAALEEILTKIGDAVLRAASGKKTDQILYELREKNIQNIARHQADDAPARASRLVEILEKMNRGEKL